MFTTDSEREVSDGHSRESMLATELEGLADKGVAMSAIDSQLEGRALSRDEYDEMWLYAWSLMEGRAARDRGRHRRRLVRLRTGRGRLGSGTEGATDLAPSCNLG